jgi:isocitrate/isopropylmalate dehydrogenase
VSDLCAGFIGGLGMAPGANILLVAVTSAETLGSSDITLRSVNSLLRRLTI